MIAAVDSSCLILLAKAEAIQLLSRLFQGVVVAPAVHEEAIAQAPTTAEKNSLSIEIDRLHFVTVRPRADVADRLRLLFPVLGRGELETLALVASKKAQVAVMDDRIARQAARLEGLPTVGTLGILAKAHAQGLFSKAEVAQTLGRLTAAGLWLSPDVLEAFWAGVGGR